MSPLWGTPDSPIFSLPSPHDHVGDTTQREADSRVCPRAPASDSRSQGMDFSLQPDSRLHFPVQRAKVTSWGPGALRGGGLRWSPPTHHLQLRLPGGAWSWKFSARQAQALRFCGGTALGEDCLVEEGWGSDSTLDSPPLASATVSSRLPASTLSPPLFSPRVLRALF